MLANLHQNVSNIWPLSNTPKKGIELRRRWLVGREVIPNRSVVVVSLKKLFEAYQRSRRTVVVDVSISVDAVSKD